MSPKAIVLDIDHTLLHSTHKPVNSGYFVSMKIPKANVYTKLRPGVAEFLESLPDVYDIIVVWSAGEYEYVHNMVKILFRKVSYKPDVIMTRNDCDKVGSDMYYKPLYKTTSHPKLKKYNLIMDDLIILDDRTHTFTVNDKCGILAMAYNGEDNDGYLLSLTREWTPKSRKIDIQSPI